MIVGHIGGAAKGYQIQRSLRFRQSATGYLNRTLSVNSAPQKVTWSFWLKQGSLSADWFNWIARSGPSSNDVFQLVLNTTGLAIFARDAGLIVQANGTVPMTLRDPSAWYHIVIAIDTTQAVNYDRFKIYKNNELQANAAASVFNQNAILQNLFTNAHYLQTNFGSATYADSYLTEFHCVDGQALTPSSFGQIDAATGQWVAKKYTGTYGINGFYLDFKDPTSTTTLCADKSGNGNNWTANGISLTAGATYDSMLDVPAGNGGGESGNYAVLSALGGGLIPTNGNLTCNQGAASWASIPSTISQTTGKWYFEIGQNGVSGTNYPGAGLRPPGMVGAGEYAGSVAGSFGLAVNNTSINSYSGGVAGPTMSGTYTAASVFQVVVDFDAGKIWFGDGTSYVGGGNPISGASPTYTFAAGTELVPYVCAFALQTNVNFGQRPFAYTPPAGFKALHTGNLPAPVIKKPSDHFNVVLATGANIKSTAEALYASFLEWIKDRANANNWQQIDSVRGAAAVLQSNTPAAETTYTAPTGSSAAAVWKAGSAAVTNNAGSISSQVSANVLAGFSIVTYTGTGVNATVGHGLGIALKMVIVKNRGGATDWVLLPDSTLLAGSFYLNLNLTAAKTANSDMYPSFPGAGSFSISTNTSVNANGNAHVAYCFAEVPGFSKFGSYTGNGIADGPFVHCGFRPRLVMIKRVDLGGAGASWWIFDSMRNSFNVVNSRIGADLAVAEASDLNTLDLTANGFKIRDNNAAWNASGGTYIFLAFAEAPFKYANAR